MSTSTRKSAPDGSQNSISSETQQQKINEVKKLIGPQSGNLALYCSDDNISRYLRARNWSVRKSAKMLKATLKWRQGFKPQEIRWEDVAMEAETGKIYRSNFKDKQGRPVLVMRPRCQNSKSTGGQIKYLVYCMENAISNLPPGQEQMVWLVDFNGFSMSNISVRSTRETANILQEHYPERLSIAILYDPPKIFEPFWKVAKPFLDPSTANKVKFIYSEDPNAHKFMDSLFDMQVVESTFGGKDTNNFDFNKYAEAMKEDDRRSSSQRTYSNASPPAAISTNNDDINEGSDSDSDSSAVYLTATASMARQWTEDDNGLSFKKSHGTEDGNDTSLNKSQVNSRSGVEDDAGTSENIHSTQKNT